jgi:hypothetical protein
MFARVRQLIRDLFPPDLLLRALPVFIIIGGLIIFGASYVVFPKDVHPDWHDATKSLGQAVLVSGVVNTLLSSLTYIGIFQQAIYDVMYSDKYLKTRTDLPELWRRVTSAITQDKFSTLTQQLYPRILSKYLPSDKNFIYSRFDRECILDWESKQDNIVNWKETIEVILTPWSPNEEIEYKYVSKTDSRTPRDLAKINIDFLEIDGTNYNHVLQEEEYDDEFGNKGLHSYYSIKLIGKPEYKITRVLTRKICLLQDPVMEYGSPQFIVAKTVRVRSQAPESLRAVFVSVGSDQFEDKATGPAPFWSIHKELTGPLIPNQGYIVFIQHV